MFNINSTNNRQESRKQPLYQTRRNRGAAFALTCTMAVTIAACLVVPCVLTSKKLIVHARQEDAVNAAALAAATELSKVVYKDPYFGFISLSDYPAVGKTTLGSDGKPLPVNSINSILATCRLEIQIAMYLGNAQMMEQAKSDLAQCRRASVELQQVLSDSLSSSSQKPVCDLNGDVVSPYEKAWQEYTANRPNDTKNQELVLNLGWLDAEAKSITPASDDIWSAKNKNEKDYYPAFKDVPIGNESFYFAGVDLQPSLVQSNAFRQPDGKRICSIVQATLFGRPEKQHPRPIIADACAMPFSLAIHRVPGVLAIHFPDGLTPNAHSIADLFRYDSLYRLRMPLKAYQAIANEDASGKQVATLECDDIPSDQLGKALFDWVRNCGPQLKMASLIQCMYTQFDNAQIPGTNSRNIPTIYFEMNQDGSIGISKARVSTCPNQTVIENRLCAL